MSGCNNSESESENQNASDSELKEDKPTTTHPVVINTTLAPQPLEETTPFEHFQFGDDISVEEEDESSQELTTLRPKEIFTTEAVDPTNLNWATTFSFDNELKESLPLILGTDIEIPVNNEFQISTVLTESVPIEEVTTDPTVATSEKTTMEAENTTAISEELSTLSDETKPIREESTLIPEETTTPNITTTSTSTMVLPTSIQTRSSTLTVPWVETNDDKNMPSGM